MLHALSAHLARSGLVIAVAGTALTLATGQALAVGGWTIASAPPTGQNATLTGVATVSDSDAWAVGYRNGNAFTNVGAKVLIDNWNGTAWSQVATPATPGNTALLLAVSASSATDAWAVGRTQIQQVQLRSRWPCTGTAPPGRYRPGLPPRSRHQRRLSRRRGGHQPERRLRDRRQRRTAVGSLAHWNGTAWSPVTLPLPPNAPSNTTLNAISADGPNDVWIVGTFLDSANGQNETFSMHFNGIGLERGADAAGEQLEHQRVLPVQRRSRRTAPATCGRSATAASRRAGSQTLIEHFNGTAWCIVPSPSPGSNAMLGGVTTSNAANNVWAVGADTPAGTTTQQTLTLNWNGTAWTVVASPNVALGRGRRGRHQPRRRDRLGGRRERHVRLVQPARPAERLNRGRVTRPATRGCRPGNPQTPNLSP